MNKEKLQKDIEQLKNKLAEMEAELKKPKKFEWEYPYGYTFTLEMARVENFRKGISVPYIEHGRYRISRRYAEHSLERNRVANRLEALAEQIEPDYVVPAIGNRAYRIMLLDSGKYSSSWDGSIRNIGNVYMSKETAAKVVNMLNSGEVEL